MPQNPVTDLITDHEIAFAQLLERRNAITEKLAGQGTEGRNLNFGRDQILTRLWELANVKPEQTRGSITGQIKAMSMILAMEGFLPARRLSSHPAQLAPAPKEQPAAAQVPDPAPPPKPATEAASPVQNHNQPSQSSPFTNSKAKSWFPVPGNAYDVNLNAAGPLRLPDLSQGNGSARPR